MPNYVIYDDNAVSNEKMLFSLAYAGTENDNYLRGGIGEGIHASKKKVDAFRGDYNDKAERHLYEVEIPDSKEMLKGETQLRFQPKAVREALEKAGLLNRYEYLTGTDFLNI